MTAPFFGLRCGPYYIQKEDGNQDYGTLLGGLQAVGLNI